MKCLVSLVAIVLLSVGCGSSGNPQGPEDLPDVVGAETTDVPTKDVTGCWPSSAPDTAVSVSTMVSGESTTVSCVLPGCPEADESVFGFVVAGEEGVDYQVSGQDVVFLAHGDFEVACTYEAADGTVMQDESPATVHVQPGEPASILTKLEVTEVEAGTTVPVECSAKDEQGNPLYGGFSLQVEPGEGVSISGTTLKPTVVGKYHVVCVYAGTFVGDLGAGLKVVPNVPAKVFTELSQDTVVAGKSVSIQCMATDKWDNKVGGFPMVVYVPSQLILSGLSISGKVAGFYEVKCLPQAQDWALFSLFYKTLTVLPDEPAAVKLTVVPQKAFYKLLDKINLQVAVRDKYDNLIPDAQLLPVEIKTVEGMATDGAVETQPWTYKFVEEDQYIFTVKLQSNPQLAGSVAITVDGTGPLLSIDYPERGATLGDKPSVTVTGSVTDQSGLDAFTINGENVDVEVDNSFSHIVIAGHAVNLLQAEAVDPDGQETRTVQAYAFAEHYYPGEGDDEATFIPAGIQLFLAESFVDDGDHDPSAPDDLATLMEMVLGGLDFASLLPNPVYNANSYQVFIKNASLSSPVVQMDLIEGALTIKVEFKDFSADVEAIGSCNVLGVDLCPDANGTLTVAKISFYSTVALGLDGAGNVTAVPTEFHLGIEGIKLDLSGIGSLLDPILNGIISLFEGQVEAALSAQIEQMLPSLVAEVFSQFELNANVELGPIAEGGDKTVLKLETRYALLDATPAGLYMHFDTRVSSTKKVIHHPLGSLARGNCAGPETPAFTLDSSKEMAIGVSDDVLNQLLFAVWYGAGLDADLTEENLADVAGTFDGYGITEPAVSTDFFLAPMISDCNSDKVLRFGLGDLYLDAKFKMLGQPLVVGAFASVIASASLSLVIDGPDSGIALSIDEITSFEYEIVSVTQGFEELVPIIEELLAANVLEEGLGKVAGASFGGLQLPEIDLSGLVPGVPPGTTLSFLPTSLERQAGFTQMTGVLE